MGQILQSNTDKGPAVVEGTTNPSDMTGLGFFPVSALPVMSGDAGSGGTGGTVPAPKSGDAAAGRFLKADGSWSTPPGGPGGNGTPGGSSGDIQYNNGGSFGGETLVPLANGGTNADLSASGSVTSLLAQDAKHVISARSLVAADYPTMVGDSGLGGVQGAVPAPSAGDAAANKFLKADGSWTQPTGGGQGLTSVGLSTDSGFLTVSNSPLTANGTISLNLTKLPANQVLATPNGSTGSVSPRALVAADIPQAVTAFPTAGFTSPSPVYTPGETPISFNPCLYIQDVNGNWHPQAGVDTSTTSLNGSGPIPPDGAFTFLRRTWFRDTDWQVQGFKNSFVGINHYAGATTAQTNQDRALSVWMSNVSSIVGDYSIDGSNNVTFYLTATPNWRPGMVATPNGLSTPIGLLLNGIGFTITSVTSGTVTGYNSTFTHAAVAETPDSGYLDQTMYAMEGIQVELDIVGHTPVITGSPDGEAATLSLQCASSTTGNWSVASGWPATCLRLSTSRSNAGYCSSGYSGANIQVWNSNGADLVWANFTGINIHVWDTIGAARGVGNAIYITAPGNRFLSNNNGLYIEDYGVNTSDWAIKVLGGQTELRGPTLHNNFAVATSSTKNSSPAVILSSQYWNGSSSALDSWTIQSSLAAGTNGASTLGITHAGSGGVAIVQVPILNATAPITPGKYTVAALPSTAATGMIEGAVAYATNGLKIGETASNGTGVPVFYSAAGPAGAGWYVYSSATLVAA